MEETSMKLELATYVTRWSQTKHIWGETDCMLFAVCWHDTRFGTDKKASLYQKYNSKFEAVRFYKNFLTVESWLKVSGYKKLTAIKPKFKDGDFIVKNQKHIDQGWLYFNGSFYTMDEERGLIRINPGVVDYDTVWRQT